MIWNLIDRTQHIFQETPIKKCLNFLCEVYLNHMSVQKFWLPKMYSLFSSSKDLHNLPIFTQSVELIGENMKNKKEKKQID